MGHHPAESAIGLYTLMVRPMAGTHWPSSKDVSLLNGQLCPHLMAGTYRPSSTEVHKLNGQYILAIGQGDLKAQWPVHTSIKQGSPPDLLAIVLASQWPVLNRRPPFFMVGWYWPLRGETSLLNWQYMMVIEPEDFLAPWPVLVASEQ
jgi:hypothetical protein